MPLPDWARAHGPPLVVATLRSRPEDFIVTEHLEVPAEAAGEHDWLRVEKTGANTEWVARQLAKHAGIAVRDVGYSGLKDRHAITTQWFSVPNRKAPDWSTVAIEGVRVVEVVTQARKLRRGMHRANAFRIVLRGEAFESQREAIEARLDAIRRQGVPNYFGEQRFGRDAGNLALADRWAQGARLRPHERGLAISTARSFLFNELLDARVRDGSWNRVLPGDIVNLDGSGSIFGVDTPDEAIATRCAELDLHPTAPLWGEDTAGDAPGPAAWVAAFARDRVREERRSLRLRVADLQATIEGEAITLEFVLGRGAFATVVLRELGDIGDGNPGAMA